MNTPARPPAAVPQWAWAAVAACLLLPTLALAPLPIDETRYLAVAWEMHRGGDWLVPHLNGAPYHHKPPLLFWLLNLAWALTGPAVWSARVTSLVLALASLTLTWGLALRLTGSRAVAVTAAWMLAGAVYFAAFAKAVMFDMLLAACVLLAAHGVLDLAGRRRLRGILLAGVGTGLGLLAKGPVALLHLALLAGTAPWWAPGRLRGRRAGFALDVVLAAVAGLLIVLAWAIPAALAGGDDYARAIFLDQTLDRIEGAEDRSTHARPLWWYLPVLPLMWLPWTVVLRGTRAGLRAAWAQPALRLGLLWPLAGLLAFSLIGGKQAHYLLPLLPGLALATAVLVHAGGWRLRPAGLGLVLLLAGLLLALLPWLAASRPALVAMQHLSPAYGLVLGALGVLLAVARHGLDVEALALAGLALVLVVRLAVAFGSGGRYDIAPVAAEIHAVQARGQAIVHMGWHHGLYAFAGRLEQPLPVIGTRGELQHWTERHPDTLVMSFYPNFRFLAEPVFSQPFRGGRIGIWRARDALASGTGRPGWDAPDEGA